MPLRCSALLSCSAAMHRTAIPRPSCSSLSYATAELIPALLLLWLSAPCVLCLSSAIPSSSMLLLCGRSVASHCPAVLCHSNSIPGFSIAMQVNSRPCLCRARRFPATPCLCRSRLCFAFALSAQVIAGLCHCFSSQILALPLHRYAMLFSGIANLRNAPAMLLDDLRVIAHGLDHKLGIPGIQLDG